MSFATSMRRVLGLARPAAPTASASASAVRHALPQPPLQQLANADLLRMTLSATDATILPRRSMHLAPAAIPTSTDQFAYVLSQLVDDKPVLELHTLPASASSPLLSAGWHSLLNQVSYRCSVWSRWQTHKTTKQTNAAIYRRAVLNAFTDMLVDSADSADDVTRVMDVLVGSLSTRLADKQLFFHSSAQPSDIDTYLYSYLTNAFNHGVQPQQPVVIDYMYRLTQRWYPEYSTLLQRLSASRKQAKLRATA